MITTEGGGCLRREPGFWFGLRPHTPAKRALHTHSPLMSQDGDASCEEVRGKYGNFVLAWESAEAALARAR
jgi:hypothetical protein